MVAMVVSMSVGIARMNVLYSDVDMAAIFAITRAKFGICNAQTVSAFAPIPRKIHATAASVTVSILHQSYR